MTLELIIEPIVGFIVGTGVGYYNDSNIKSELEIYTFVSEVTNNNNSKSKMSRLKDKLYKYRTAPPVTIGLMTFVINKGYSLNTISAIPTAIATACGEIVGEYFSRNKRNSRILASEQKKHLETYLEMLTNEAGIDRTDQEMKEITSEALEYIDNIIEKNRSKKTIDEIKKFYNERLLPAMTKTRDNIVIKQAMNKDNQNYELYLLGSTVYDKGVGIILEENELTIVNVTVEPKQFTDKELGKKRKEVFLQNFSHTIQPWDGTEASLRKVIDSYKDTTVILGSYCTEKFTPIKWFQIMAAYSALYKKHVMHIEDEEITVR